MTLNFETTRGPVRIRGSRVGAFGVHRTLGASGRLCQFRVWTVTHLPTGATAGQTWRSLATARRVARRLSTLKGNWAFTKVKKMPKALRIQGKAVVDEERARQAARR